MDGFQMHGHGDENDLFDMINGGGGGGGLPFGIGGGGLFNMFGGGRRRPRKGETTVQPLNVTLEDLYKGKTTKLQLTKKALCKTCNGIGGKQGSVQTCTRCRGQGRVLITRQFAPGMIQQMQTRCEQCNGTGEIIDEKDKCKKCEGRKTVQEQKLIEVKIMPGMREGQKIVFYGEGDQEPGIEPGDVVLIVKTKSHETFERKGDDLIFKKTISLKEALCGFTTVVMHLNGRNIIIGTDPGEIIKPESLRGAIGQGMPRKDLPGQFGNLYVVFEIKFPSNHFLEPIDSYKKLESMLPARPPAPKFNADVEEVSLYDFDPRRYDRHSGGAGTREAYQDDSSDDEMPGPGGAQHVQCAQQ